MVIASCLFATLLGAVGAQPAKPPAPKDGPLGMKFVPLPKGTYFMRPGVGEVEKKAELKAAFAIAIQTVTQGQWQELMGNNSSYFSREGGGSDKVKDIKDEDLKQFPVESISWNDAQEFIKKLNQKEKGKGYHYRLPTQAEWEYACRGGAMTREECSYGFYFDKPTNDLSSTQANFIGEAPYGKGQKGPNLGRTTKVGSYTPNQLGLYDMHGNVWQMCEDLADPKEKTRIARGGSWGNDGGFCQAHYWITVAPTARQNFVGFRLVRVPERQP
jgi:formylglycine-generating enzyme required for sulfatase activity